MVKFALYSKLVLVILTLHRRGKFLEHFISIVVVLLLNILLSWAFVTSLNCSVMCKPPWMIWVLFSPFFLGFIAGHSAYCWQFNLIILVNLLLQPFFFIDFVVYPGLPLFVFLLRGVETVLEWRDRLSQVAHYSDPGNGLRKHAKA